MKAFFTVIGLVGANLNRMEDQFQKLLAESIGNRQHWLQLYSRKKKQLSFWHYFFTNETDALGTGLFDRGIGQVSTSLSAINGYGCWCYFADEHGKGHGVPVNKMDEICKVLHDGYECAIHDGSDESEECEPWTVDYSEFKMKKKSKKIDEILSCLWWTRFRLGLHFWAAAMSRLWLSAKLKTRTTVRFAHASWRITLFYRSLPSFLLERCSTQARSTSTEVFLHF